MEIAKKIYIRYVLAVKFFIQSLEISSETAVQYNSITCTKSGCDKANPTCFGMSFCFDYMKHIFCKHAWKPSLAEIEHVSYFFIGFWLLASFMILTSSLNGDYLFKKGSCL